MPKDIIEPGRVRLYQAPMKMATTLLQIGLVVIIFWILKDWVFTKIYELSGWAFAKEWANISFLFWPTIIIAGLAMVSTVLNWLSTYYEIYPERLVVRNGLVSRQRISIDMDQFTAVQTYQSVWGRLWGYGDIVFLFEAITTVVTKKGVVLAGVKRPEKLVNDAAAYIKEAGSDMRGKKTDKVGATVPVSDVTGGGVQSKTEIISETPIPQEEELVEPVPIREPESKTPLPKEPAGQIQGEIDLSAHN